MSSSFTHFANSPPFTMNSPMKAHSSSSSTSSITSPSSKMIIGAFCTPARRIHPSECSPFLGKPRQIGNYCCNFCKQNGEPVERYTSHRLRNEKNIVECPILRSHKCQFCQETGDNAHTISYCKWVHEFKYFIDEVHDKSALANMGDLRKTQFSAAGQRLFLKHDSSATHATGSISV